jgi:putative FmdB family regulatory protein
MEVLQKVSDSPLTKCQKCEGKVERLVSSPAIQFKGTGWYITDYARKGQRPSDSSSTDSSSKDSTSKTSRSKDSGPAASASGTS